MSFKIISREKNSNARVGRLVTAHGTVDTPAFMPVGTQATVKTLTPRTLKKEISAGIILSNAYHLFIRPGIAIIKKGGGLHKFMSWDGPILTDSGGYQIFSLATFQKIEEDGVAFSSHFDGRKLFLKPEDVIKIQFDLGSDIMMVLDECLPYPSERSEVTRSIELTARWARRSKQEFNLLKRDNSRLLFGIVQGGIYPDLRRQSAEKTIEIGFDGYAIGGLSVGEGSRLRNDVVGSIENVLPKDMVRYLMGVGDLPGILDAVSLGIDLFDCTLPTRLGRNGTAFTSRGRLVVRNAQFKDDTRPIDQSCQCYACSNFSRSYLRHLFNTEEILGPTLLSLHNVYFYVKFMKEIREAIKQKSFERFKKEFNNNYNQREEN